MDAIGSPAGMQPAAAFEPSESSELFGPSRSPGPVSIKKKKPTSIAGGSSYAAQRAYPNRGA